jgi:hypothetical protein
MFNNSFHSIEPHVAFHLPFFCLSHGLIPTGEGISVLDRLIPDEVMKSAFELDDDDGMGDDYHLMDDDGMKIPLREEELKEKLAERIR